MLGVSNKTRGADTLATLRPYWRKVLGGLVDELVVIAAPRTLGELRKH